MKVLDSAVMPVVVTESGPSPSLRIHAKGRAQMIQNPRSMSTKISNVFRNEGFMFLAERQSNVTDCQQRAPTSGLGFERS